MLTPDSYHGDLDAIHSLIHDLGNRTVIRSIFDSVPEFLYQHLHTVELSPEYLEFVRAESHDYSLQYTNSTPRNLHKPPRWRRWKSRWLRRMFYWYHRASAPHAKLYP